MQRLHEAGSSTPGIVRAATPAFRSFIGSSAVGFALARRGIGLKFRDTRTNQWRVASAVLERVVEQRLAKFNRLLTSISVAEDLATGGPEKTRATSRLPKGGHNTTPANTAVNALSSSTSSGLYRAALRVVQLVLRLPRYETISRPMRLAFNSKGSVLSRPVQLIACGARERAIPPCLRLRCVPIARFGYTISDDARQFLVRNKARGEGRPIELTGTVTQVLPVRCSVWPCKWA